MDQKTVQTVMSHAEKGRTVLLGFGNGGDVKVKVKYGPMGLITRRFATDHDTFEEIRRRLRVRRGF